MILKLQHAVAGTVHLSKPEKQQMDRQKDFLSRSDNTNREARKPTCPWEDLCMYDHNAQNHVASIEPTSQVVHIIRVCLVQSSIFSTVSIIRTKLSTSPVWEVGILYSP